MSEIEVLDVAIAENPEVDLDLEHAVAVAEHEGLPPVPEADNEPDPEVPAETPDQSTSLEWALRQIIEVNQACLDQKAVVKEKQVQLKDEKETLESLQDQLNRLIVEASRARAASEPDPDRFPLFDKAEINATFAKPQAIPPLPASDFEEFARRKSCETRLDSLGLSGKIGDILADVGLATIDDLRRKVDVLAEANVDLGSIKGLTEARREKLMAALADFHQRCQAEWDAAHPELETDADVH